MSLPLSEEPLDPASVNLVVVGAIATRVAVKSNWGPADEATPLGDVGDDDEAAKLLLLMLLLLTT